MGFFSKKKATPKKPEKKKEAPAQKSPKPPAPAKVVQPPKQTLIEQTLHDRVLTAEGWRRRVNARAKKSSR